MKNIITLFAAGLILFFLYVITSNDALAKKRDVSIALTYENQINNNAFQDVLGINLEFFIYDNISLNYNYSIS